MISNIYEIERDGCWVILSRKIFPRLKLFINRDNPSSSGINIKLLDQCHPHEIMEALQEMISYLKSIGLRWKN